MTGDTNTPCTAHRAVQLAFDELAWRTNGHLTMEEIVAYAGTRGRTLPEVQRVLARQLRLGRIRKAGHTFERVDIPMSTRELRATRPPWDRAQQRLGGA